MTTHAHRITPIYLEKLQGNLNFIRISMDGIGTTYEKIRGKAFEELLAKISLVRKSFPFGINYVVNTDTIRQLDEAVRVAEDKGASEFLLLPEVALGRGKCISIEALEFMKKWIKDYRGRLRLSISESHAEALPICHPFKHDIGLRAYAHIDANGILKKTSFDRKGVSLNKENIMEALETLRNQEKMKEAL